MFSRREPTFLRLTNSKNLIFGWMRNWIITLGVLSITHLTLWSQQTMGLEPVSLSRPMRVDQDGDSIVVYQKNGATKKVKALLKDSLSLSSFVPIQRADNLLFINYIGGQVLEWHNDTISRIDHSYEHRNQLNSAIFQRNDTIFRFGGYGFFESRNFFTYFDYKTKEWNSYKTKPGLLPPGLSGVKYFVDSDGFYLFGGHSIDPHDKFINHPNNEIWHFSFVTKTWTLKGAFNVLTKLEGRTTDFQLGNQLFFFLTDRMFSFDVLNGQVVQYPTSSAYNSINYSKPVFVTDKSIKFSITANNNNTLELLYEQNLDSALENPVLIEKTYTNSYPYWLAGGLALVVLGGLGVWWMRQRGQSPQLSVNGVLLEYKRKSIPLTPEESAFMGLFLNQIEVEVSDLLDVLQDTKVVYSQKMRIKEEIISSLNNKLYLLTGSKDFEIVSKKSKADKRMKVYRLKQKD